MNRARTLLLPAVILLSSGLQAWAQESWSGTTTTGAPTARTRATAVWTGREMIVWGGQAAGTAVATGARYDPQSDTWTALPAASAPTARFDHTAVWTGREMIVWGGWDGTTSANTGARYNPVTNAWTALTTTAAPAARREHSAVWTGREMIVWGGSDGTALNTGGKYDPTTGTWSAVALAAAPVGRSRHTAVWAEGRMIVWGGWDGASPLGSGSCYDPEANTWTLVTTVGAPTARREHTATWTGREMVVWGGTDGAALNTGARYDPRVDAWVPLSASGAPSARTLHSALWTGREVVVWGGTDGVSPVSTGARFDPFTDAWTTTLSTGVPAARSRHASVWTGSMMLVWGGEPETNMGGRYRAPNSPDDAWTATPTAGAPSPRRLQSAVWTGREMIIWGGYDGNNLNTGGRFDPVTNAWMPTSLTGAPSGRYGHSAVWTDREMIVYGAGAGGGRYNPLTDSWSPMSAGGADSGNIAFWSGREMINLYGAYDPRTDTWRSIPNYLNRTYTSGVWTGREMIVWGGYQGGSTDSGGRYDPVTNAWTPTTQTGAPSPRERHRSVWTGREMIVWGGHLTAPGSNPLGTGARYDPLTDSWTPTSLTGAPQPRYDHIAVWTGREMIAWGGSNNFDYDTLGGDRYDPVTDTWSPTTTTNKPVGRLDFTGIWTGREMIIWGGQYPNTNTGGRYGIGYSPTPVLGALSQFQSDGTTVLATGTSSNSTTVVLKGAVSDPDGGQTVALQVEVRPVGTPFTNIPTTVGTFVPAAGGTSVATVSGLASGQYHWQARAIDSAHVYSGFSSYGGNLEDQPDFQVGNAPTVTSVSAASPNGTYGYGQTITIAVAFSDVVFVTGTPQLLLQTGEYSAVATYSSGSGTTTLLFTYVVSYGNTSADLSYVSSSSLQLNGGTLTGPSALAANPTLPAPGAAGSLSATSSLVIDTSVNLNAEGWTSTATAGAPSARTGATAVWTDRELIVWGGQSGGGALGTGARYEPLSNTWTPLPASGAPSARFNHTAVWTGREMIVWGGTDGTTPANSGARYDPATNAWTVLPTTGAPSARQEHSAVWTGREMIIWGGTNGTVQNSGARFETTSNTWTAVPTAGAPAARSRHAAVWAERRMIVWGGWDGSNPLGTGAGYDPDSGTWTSVTAVGAPSARYRHTATWTGREMIVWGGTNGAAQNTGARYDPQVDAWVATPTAASPSGRMLHSALWTGRDLVVWGGSDGVSPVNTGGRYDPVTNLWSSVPLVGAPSARSGQAAAWTGRVVIVWGGTPETNTGGRYRPPNWPLDAWDAMPTAGAPQARRLHCSVWTGREMIIWGGWNGSADISTGGRYDPVTNSWTAISTVNAPGPRDRHTGVWTGREMIVWGGGSSTGGRYDPVTDSWALMTAAGIGLTASIAVWTGSEMIVNGGNGEAYNPRTDTWRNTGTSSPAPRTFFAGVWTGREMIIWGGYAGTGLDSGGRYDPVTDAWTPTTTVGAPLARNRHSAVWTGREMIVWGGFTGTKLDTGAMYNPILDSWSPTSQVNAPEPRCDALAVWTGREMILWGGDGFLGPVATGGRFEPTSNTWVAMTGAGAPRYRTDFSGVWTGREMIAWGGQYPDTNTGGRYRGAAPATPGWIQPEQLRNDGVTPIALGAMVSDSTVRLRGFVYDPNPAETVALQVEVRSLGTPFTGIPTGTGPFVSGSGAISEVNVPALATGSYHWQARTINSSAVVGAFASFGGNLESSADFRLDTSPPTAGTVLDGNPGDVAYQSSATTIQATWSGFGDAESGIAGYEWAIGTTAGGTQTQGFVPVGLSTSTTASSLSLVQGTTYYVTVRATNGVGLQTTATSNGVFVDTVPPVGGVVNDGRAADVDVQTSVTTIEANWSGFSDAQSGIVGYEWAIGSTPGGQEIRVFESVGLMTQASTSAVDYVLALQNGQTVYVSVRATNGSGLATVAVSDGVQVATSDVSPPAPPAMFVALGSNGAVLLEWNPSASADVSSYQVWWKPSSAPWFAATLIEGLTGTSTTIPTLTNGALYDFMLKAVDASGNESTGVFAAATPQPGIRIQGVGGSYPSIQFAINAAVAGQTILVGPGTYVGDLSLGAGVSIQGTSPRHTVLQGAGGGPVIVIGGSYPASSLSTVSMLTLENGSVGVQAGIADVLLRNVVVHDIAGPGVTASASGRLQIINCTLMGNLNDGINSAALTTVRNTVAGKNGGTGILAPPTSVVTYSNAYLNVTDFGPGIAGTGNSSVGASFIDETAHDYRETSASETIDLGDPTDLFPLEPLPNGGRINQGAYGNTPWAASTPPGGGGNAGGGGGGGGGCGATGLEILIIWAFARSRKR
jgi:N-acetylneuraminic acid mutarotase